MTICPCCGIKFEGTLSDGCHGCGARAVGEALPRPKHELPSYGRSLSLVIAGSLIALVFIVQTILAMVQKLGGDYSQLIRFWSWVGAGETAAWRLKWISIPVLMVTLWCGLKIYRSIKAEPLRFCGIKYARNGLLASAIVGFLIALLIGITVPARLRQRQMAIDAGHMAQYYRLELALTEYQEKFKTLPDQNTLKEDLAKLPDPDGTIAAALRDLDPTGYQPRGEVAAVDTAKEKRLNVTGAIIRKASFTSATDDTPPPGLAFTDYDLRLPGEDKILGTDDDWVGRHGVIKKLADAAKGGVGRSVSAGVLQP